MIIPWHLLSPPTTPLTTTQAFTEKDISSLSRIMGVRHVAAHELVAYAGDCVSFVGIVLSGSIKETAVNESGHVASASASASAHVSSSAPPAAVTAAAALNRRAQREYVLAVGGVIGAAAWVRGGLNANWRPSAAGVRPSSLVAAEPSVIAVLRIADAPALWRAAPALAGRLLAYAARAALNATERRGGDARDIAVRCEDRFDSGGHFPF